MLCSWFHLFWVNVNALKTNKDSFCFFLKWLCTEMPPLYINSHFILYITTWNKRNVVLFTPLHTLIWLLILYIDILHHANTVIVYYWVLKDHQFECSRLLLVMKYFNNAVLIFEVTWRFWILIPYWFQYIHSRGQQETSNVALALQRVCLV